VERAHSRLVPERRSASAMAGAVSYHLIFSPTFLPRVLYWVVVQGSFLRMALAIPEAVEFFGLLYAALTERLMFLSYQASWWSMISFLSSACCAFQLILNLFSVGCAGFNTALGPARPFFIGTAVTGQVWMWSRIEKPQEQIPQAVASTVLVVSMTFLPEFLYLLNSKAQSRAPPHSAEKRTKTSQEKGSHTAVEAACRLKIEGMGCVACVNKIRQALTSQEAVAEIVQISLEHGSATVRMAAGKTGSAGAVADAVSECGFPSVVMSEADSAANGNAAKPKAETGPEGEGLQDASGAMKACDPFSLFQGLLAGLLGSSCCILQLGLNCLSFMDVLHVGCAGFNKALGPLRVHLRIFTFAWLGYCWYHYCRLAGRCGDSKAPASRLRRRLLTTTCVTLLLMFLPELLKVGGAPAIAPGFSGDLHGPDVHFAEYSVAGMGCEACVDMVTRVIQSHSGVISSEVEFETGAARLYVARSHLDVFDPRHLDAELRVHGYELHEKGSTAQQRSLDAK